MAKKVPFSLTFFSILMASTIWSGHLSSRANRRPASLVPSSKSTEEIEIHRREITERMDRLVTFERYYRSLYGHYTANLEEVGLGVPAVLRPIYDVQVARATVDNLLILAFSEKGSDGLHDMASIDQNFQLHTNFDAPTPRPLYLEWVAKRHLRTLKNSPEGELTSEASTYKGYFRYTTQAREGNQLIFAEGIRFPVENLQIKSDLVANPKEYQDVETDLLVTQRDSKHTPLPDHGLSVLKEGLSLEEKASIGQKIYQGEMGRYATDWNELSDLVAFEFEGKEQFNLTTIFPFIARRTPLTFEKLEPKESEASEHSSHHKYLIVERISPLVIEPAP